jgi:hypothetical protein
VNDADRKEELMEDVEGERLTTADLVDAGREEPRNGNLDIARADVVTSPRDERRVPVAPVTVAGRSSVQAVPASQAGVGATATATAMAMAKEPESGPLFSQEEAGNLRTKWDAIQVGFVDEPRRAVEDADSLVAMAMKRLAEQFAEERSRLEGQWDRGGDVSTEDLRIALRRYRSFFGRLLSV